MPVCSYYYYCTRGGSRLHDVVKNWHEADRHSVFFRIANHFILPMARSTWILAFAIFLVFATSVVFCCSTRELGGGMWSFALSINSSLLIVNPRSAKIISPVSRRSRKPDWLTMCLSDVQPPQPAEMKLIMPLGAM